MMTGTVERARGRWREILPQLGIETRFLKNKTGPCPLCGGRDRYRFDDRDGTGTYFCNQCGAGNGFTMIRKLKGWDFPTACIEIDKIIGNAAPVSRAAPAVARSDEQRARDIQRLLDEADDPQVVHHYLKGRVLSVISPVLRGHRRCLHFDADHRLDGVFPAVIAPVIGPNGDIRTAHRIYVAPALAKPERKKNMLVIDTINGGAVRLFDPEEELGVGEGIETMLAVREMFGLPVWACLVANGVKTFVPPLTLKRLHIYADNDANYTGQSAAFALANRVAVQNEIPVEVHIPRLSAPIGSTCSTSGGSDECPIEPATAGPALDLVDPRSAGEPRVASPRN
jgi:putative DNA primase/helicase